MVFLSSFFCSSAFFLLLFSIWKLPFRPSDPPCRNKTIAPTVPTLLSALGTVRAFPSHPLCRLQLRGNRLSVVLKAMELHDQVKLSMHLAWNRNQVLGSVVVLLEIDVVDMPSDRNRTMNLSTDLSVFESTVF